MANNKLHAVYQNICLADNMGNIYKIAVSGEDYHRIISEPAFAIACLKKAIELGVPAEKSISLQNTEPFHESETDVTFSTEFDVVENVCDKNNETNGSPFVNKWVKKNTLLLIELFQTYKEEFETSRRKKDVWVKINAGLKEKGYRFSTDDCDNKWRNLKLTYKKIKDKTNKTGRGKQSWDYFEIMDEVLCAEHSIKPVNLLYTTKSTSDLSNISDEMLSHSELGGSTSSLNNASTSNSNASSTSTSNASSTSSLNPDNSARDSSNCFIFQKSKKRKVKATEAPEWFTQWNEDNRKFEEKTQQQTKEFQEEILKRLDAKNACLEKITDAFLKM